MTASINFQAKQEICVEGDTSPKITANVLFNFMRKYEYLEKVISNMAINPRYYPVIRRLP